MNREITLRRRMKFLTWFFIFWPGGQWSHSHSAGMGVGYPGTDAWSGRSDEFTGELGIGASDIAGAGRIA